MLVQRKDGRWDAICDDCEKDRISGVDFNRLPEVMQKRGWTEEVPSGGRARHHCRRCRVRNMLGREAVSVVLD